LEEFYIEELILKESTTDVNLNKSAEFYARWKEMANKSQINNLNEYVYEAGCFFGPNIPDSSYLSATKINGNNDELSNNNNNNNNNINSKSTPSFVCMNEKTTTTTIRISKSETKDMQQSFTKIDTQIDEQQHQQQSIGFNVLGEPIEFIK
jgi:hypothetical protein